MTISAASGSKLYVGTTLAAENLSQFLNDTYVEVGEVEDLGEFGDEAELVTFASLSDSRMQKLKGVRDAGNMAVVVGMDDSNAGQDAMVAAEQDTLDYNFKVVLNDKQTVSGTPSEHYFRGKVMSRRTAVGSANNVVRQNFTVAINSAVLSIDAT